MKCLERVCTYMYVCTYNYYKNICVKIFNLLGEFGCVYKGLWTQKELKTSDVVAIKTIKSMQACSYVYMYNNY